jgi:hypothetical protein
VNRTIAEAVSFQDMYLTERKVANDTAKAIDDIVSSVNGNSNENDAIRKGVGIVVMFVLVAFF